MIHVFEPSETIRALGRAVTGAGNMLVMTTFLELIGPHQI